MEAQIGVESPVDAISGLIADSLLDFFEMRLKPGVTLPQ
ncbi:hypothetical protein FB470_001869 [Amycolatopsis thermophila]|uniref:Uncharacterized protein n=1 Tax=Amycolatopsis thermophila TaxID=206084 RepID=A0ABU0ESE1_9PSEU|nr:hypothetical protein [Amycolatopsis thermophila]